MAYIATSHCPRLYELYLRIPPSLDSSLFPTLLHPHTFATLRALEIFMTDHDKNDLHFTNLFQFLHQFSALSHLRLDEILGEIGSPPSLAAPSFHLIEFAWTNKHISNSFQLLTGKSSNNLRILEFYGYSRNWDIYAGFISNHGRNVTSLRLDVWDQEVQVLESLNAQTCQSSFLPGL
ncbi:hypothetical protein FRC02_011541 [Tulasnella sp. 418]|nr:hypothetical protein FRC02_011541 [Tulasnella sp. 418]